MEINSVPCRGRLGKSLLVAAFTLTEALTGTASLLQQELQDLQLLSQQYWAKEQTWEQAAAGKPALHCSTLGWAGCGDKQAGKIQDMGTATAAQLPCSLLAEDPNPTSTRLCPETTNFKAS